MCREVDGWLDSTEGSGRTGVVSSGIWKMCWSVEKWMLSRQCGKRDGLEGWEVDYRKVEGVFRDVGG